MNFPSRCLRSALAAAILMVFAASGRAQDATSGSISGTVTDSTGAAIKGATVVLTNTDRNHVERTVTTDGAGFYTARSLPLGTYAVKVTDSGFKTNIVTSLALHVGDALTLNRALPAGDTSESVTVTADDARVNLEDAASASLINSTQINEMPLLTRNYESLLNLQPGVVFGGGSDQLARGAAGPGGSSNQVNFSVNGGRNTSNNWTIDGADNVDRGSSLTLYVYPSPDAIAEFKTLRGQYSAQYGRNASGQVDVVTKSGTNTIHGSAYEFFRNDDLDANGYANNFLGQRIPKYRYNVYGFSFGGPVYIPKLYNGRNKTFFFVSQEWQRLINDAAGVQALLPMQSERNGDFSQSGVRASSSAAWTLGPVPVCTAYGNNPTNHTNYCTASGTQVTNISPTAAAYLKDIYSKIPIPQSAADLAHNIDPHTYTSTFHNVLNNSDTMVRIDQQFGQKLSVFYRYLHDTFPENLGQGYFSSTSSPIPGLNDSDAVSPGTEQLGHGTYSLSSTLVVNAGYAFSKGNIVVTPHGFLGSAQSPDISTAVPYANTSGIVSALTFSGLSSISGALAYFEHSTNHQAFGDVTKIVGNHTFIAGFSYDHYQKLENNTVSTNGSFGFTTDSYSCPPVAPNTACVTNAYTSGYNEAQSFSNFLTGNANNGFSQVSYNPTTDIKSALYEAFLQDNWKTTRRLTLNAGVRYSYYGQPWDARGQLSNFDSATYSASKAPTIASSGSICFTGVCSQAGSNAGLSTTPNPNADYVGNNYLNGLIFNGPNAANNNQASPYGNKVGTAQNLNFAPRVGFALDVFGDGRTSLRGGYGWSYDDAAVSWYETTVFSNPPSVSSYSVAQTSLDAPTGGSLSALSPSPGRILAVPVNYKTPYIQQYSLDLQQQLSPKFIIDVGYFGTHGTHLLGGENIDQPRPGAFAGVVAPPSTCIDPDTNQPAFLNSTCSLPLNQIRPYLGYVAIDTIRTIFSSNYNALQVKATKRFSGKSYFDINYTWSHDLTNSPADYSGFTQDIYNPNGDYGRAADDRTNVLTMDGVYELPWYREQKGLTGRVIGGWELSGIYTINSGLPLTVSASGFATAAYNLPGGAPSVYNGKTSTGYVTDNAGIGNFSATSAGLRVNQIGNPNAGNGTKIHNKQYHSNWFYTGAFAAAPPTQLSAPTAQRGTIQGPGFNRLDVGVFRNFRIYNRLVFQFRAEAFNAANHTNVNTISTAIGSTFGEVTGYRDARILQFAGKFTF
jgi:hypothetical protein